jgi:hypothetical protein
MIIKYNKEIQIYEDDIEMMKNRLKIESEAYKMKVKELKDLLRNNDLSDLERSVLRLILKDSNKTFQKTKKLTAVELRDEMEHHTDAIRELQIGKKEVFKSVKKTMKNMAKAEKKKEKDAQKEAAQLRKTLRKQGELQDEIKDEGIKGLVDKYEADIKNELIVSIKIEDEKIREKEDKIREKQDKMREKDILKQNKEQEKKMQQEEKKRQQEEKKMQQEEKKRQQEEKKRQRDERKTRKIKQ